MIVDDRYRAFEGDVVSGPHLRIALCTGRASRLMQEIDGTRLEGVWRPGTLAIMPPGGSGYAASGAVGMIGLAIVPALCSWTSTPPFALIKASDRSMRNEQPSAPHSNLGPRTGTSKLWWRAACPLSGVDRVKADARSGDRVGCSNARRWWKAARPLSSVHREKPDIHSGGRAKSPDTHRLVENRLSAFGRQE